jgi:hypothetical protein
VTRADLGRLAEELSYRADNLADSLAGTPADELDTADALAVAEQIRRLTRRWPWLPASIRSRNRDPGRAASRHDATAAGQPPAACLLTQRRTPADMCHLRGCGGVQDGRACRGDQPGRLDLGGLLAGQPGD